jgi:iron(III) transport system ATP-binding protein
MSGMAKISIKGLIKRFDQQTVLQNLNLVIPEGSFFTLLGPSGCGKTTLLRCIAGFNEPDSGNILFDDDDITHVPAHQRNIGMVFQDYALFPDKTVFDNVAYGLRARKVAKAECATRTEQALDRVGLKALMLRLPAQLSGGQRQRVALARAMVIKPRVLLMDEPLSNLDAKLRLSMRDMIRELQQQEQITTVFVTHDQEEALVMSDLIAVMQSGRIAQLDTPELLYTKPIAAYVADFVGSANLLPVIFHSDGQVVVSNNVLNVDTRDCDVSQPLRLVLRPELLTLTLIDTTSKSASSNESNVLPVKVLKRQYLGGKTSYRVALNNGFELQVDTAGGKVFLVGDQLQLLIPAGSRTISQ